MSVTDFYDRIAPYFHLIYPDWNATIARQGSQLDGVIREFVGGEVRTILDAACGIGTQALGLASLGYEVTASDISEGPLARAKAEAEKRGLRIEFRRADIRGLRSAHGKTFDVVIACDNVIPHFLSDAEIEDAFRELHRAVEPGGGCVISVRDYDPADRPEFKVVPYGMRKEGDRRFLVFQVWEFHGAIYDLSMYYVEDRGGDTCTTHVGRAKYYAVPVGRVVELMAAAGFRDVRRLDGRFFQPLIVGRKERSV